MVPLKEGSVVVPSTKITWKGKLYQTNPITVTVTASQVGMNTSQLSQPKAAPQRTNRNISGKDIVFLDASISDKQVYVGEQIVYNLTFYNRVRLMRNPSLEMPSFNGFWVEDLKLNQQQKLVTIQNIQYVSNEVIKKSLFPLKPGKLSIDPAKLSVVYNIFDGVKVVTSKPISIAVVPLPEENKPPSFAGHVGDFTLKQLSTIENTQQQHQPYSVKIEVSGSGNLKGIQDLDFKKTKDFRIYKSNVTDQIKSYSKITGKRIFEYIVIPRKVGDGTTPIFSLSYFDPNTKKYVTLSSSKAAINVLASVNGGDNSEDTNQQEYLQEIRYLKSIKFTPHEYLIYKKGFFKFVSWMAFIGFISLLVLSIKRQFFKQDQYILNQENAYNIAMDSLSNTINATSLLNILFTFLSNKVARDVQGLTKDKVKNLLTEYDLEVSKVQLILTIIDEFSYVEFSSAKGSDQEIEKSKEKMVTLFEDLKNWKPTIGR